MQLILMISDYGRSQYIDKIYLSSMCTSGTDILLSVVMDILNLCLLSALF